MTEVYLNGTFMESERARISPLDRGFLFADGVYEVIPAFNGVLFRIDEHLARLERSLGELHIYNPHSRETWQALCQKLLLRNGGGNASVYLQVTRGTAATRDHAFPMPPIPPTIFMTTAALNAETAVTHPDSASGAAAISADDPRWARCDIKSVSLLPNAMLRQQAVESGAVEAILTRDGFLTEGSSTNVFVVKDGLIATPPLSNRILGGITRDLVIELCRKNRMPFEEREVSGAELLDADEIWISSSTKDVMPIVSLNQKPVGHGRPGETWKALARRYVEFKRNICCE